MVEFIIVGSCLTEGKEAMKDRMSETSSSMFLCCVSVTALSNYTWDVARICGGDVL